MAEDKDAEKAAEEAKKAAEIAKLEELGKTGKVKEAYDKTYGKKGGQK